MPLALPGTQRVCCSTDSPIGRSCTLRYQILTDNHSRRSIRSSRNAILPLVRDSLPVAEIIYAQGSSRDSRRQGAKCENVGPILLFSQGTVTDVSFLTQTQSTLSLLSPLRHALLGMPFLYQRISSTSPITALIATKLPNTTFSILHLDGTTDWQIAQRNALLAWTGHTLSITPRVQRGLAPAHWGNHFVTGRGLAAIAAPGQIYEVKLGEGEELVVHPSHVVAYSVDRNAPVPFRFRSSMLRLTVPSVPETLVPQGLAKFWKDTKETGAYKFLAKLLLSLRTTARRSIFGDRLFLQFQGPTTILMSSRGARISDVLTKEDVNEIADTEAGLVARTVEGATKPRELEANPTPSTAGEITPASVIEKPVALNETVVGKDGKVSIEKKDA